MILIQKKKNISNKLTLRLIIILCSIVMFLLNVFSIINAKDPNIALLNGIFASAFVWGLLEFMDYALDLHTIYLKERNNFLFTYESGLYNLKAIIKKYCKQVDNDCELDLKYDEFSSCLIQFREKLILLQQKYEVYCLMIEMKEVLGYIERLYDFIQGITYNNTFKNMDLSEKDINYLTDKIIAKSYNKQNFQEYEFEKEEFERKVNNHVNIDICFKEYNEFISNDFKYSTGNLFSHYMLPAETWINISFRPINDFKEYRKNNTELGIIRLIFEILTYRKN